MADSSDTPETDLEEAAQTQRFGGWMVKSEFARKLERQRNSANRQLLLQSESILRYMEQVSEMQNRALVAEAALRRLLNCPDLNLDNLEPETLDALKEARSALH